MLRVVQRLYIVCFVFALLQISLCVDAGAGECRITILHFNDFHGYLSKPKKGLGGGERLAGLVGRIEKGNEKDGRYTILLNGGDLISGTPVSERFKGEAEFEFLGAVGTEAMVLGNHDFDFGIENLEKLMKGTDIPILAANVVDKKDKHLFTKATYVIPLEKDCRVGIIGLITPRTPSQTATDVSSLEFKNPVRHAEYYIEELVDQSEVQIALTHLDNPAEVQLAKRMPDLDVVVGGHDHVKPAEYCRMAGRTPLCETPAKGEYLGRIDLRLNGDRVTIEKTELIPVKGGGSKEVARLVDRYAGPIDKEMRTVVGILDRTFQHRPEEGPRAPNHLGKLVADSMRRSLSSDVSFTNLRGMRKTLKKGKVTKGDIYEALPFNNGVVVMELTGTDLEKLVAISAKAEGKEGAGERGDYLIWSGLEYGKEDGIYNIKINGKPLDKSASYRIVTLDFLARGGGGYSMLKGKRYNDSGRLLREVVIENLGS